MTVQLFDTVKLIASLESENLSAGAIGVVVAEFSEPEVAYEVEFSDDDGNTLTTVALRESQFSVVA